MSLLDVRVEHQATNRFYELMIDGTPAGLIQGALDDVRLANATLTNYCPVVGHYLETHPEYADLLDKQSPGKWDETAHAEDS